MNLYFAEIYFPPFPNKAIKWRIHKYVKGFSAENFSPDMIEHHTIKAVDMDQAKKTGKVIYDKYIQSGKAA